VDEVRIGSVELWRRLVFCGAAVGLLVVVDMVLLDVSAVDTVVCVEETLLKSDREFLDELWSLSRVVWSSD
jgi:hypothetical protein